MAQDHAQRQPSVIVLLNLQVQLIKSVSPCKIDTQNICCEGCHHFCKNRLINYNVPGSRGPRGTVVADITTTQLNKSASAVKTIRDRK